MARLQAAGCGVLGGQHPSHREARGFGFEGQADVGSRLCLSSLSPPVPQEPPLGPPNPRWAGAEAKVLHLEPAQRPRLENRAPRGKARPGTCAARGSSVGNGPLTQPLRFADNPAPGVTAP